MKWLLGAPTGDDSSGEVSKRLDRLTPTHNSLT